MDHPESLISFSHHLLPLHTRAAYGPPPSLFPPVCRRPSRLDTGRSFIQFCSRLSTRGRVCGLGGTARRPSAAKGRGEQPCFQSERLSIPLTWSRKFPGVLPEDGFPRSSRDHRHHAQRTIDLPDTACRLPGQCKTIHRIHLSFYKNIILLWELYAKVDSLCISF